MNYQLFRYDNELVNVHLRDPVFHLRPTEQRPIELIISSYLSSLHLMMVGYQNQVQWHGIYNPQTNECLVKVWEAYKDEKPNNNLSNCRTKKIRKITDQTNKHLRGDWEYYQLHLNVCDNFNIKMHYRKWSFRNGGNSRTCDASQEDNMVMTTILQDTFNVYFDLYPEIAVLGTSPKDF